MDSHNSPHAVKRVNYKPFTNKHNILAYFPMLGEKRGVLCARHDCVCIVVQEDEIWTPPKRPLFVEVKIK